MTLPGIDARATGPASANAVGLSIVLPCFRSADLAARSVQRLADFLPAATESWEVVVIDDGGGDFAPNAFEAEPRVRLIRLPRNRGKGVAVAHGMRAARGTVRIYTDVDLPYDVELIPAIVHYIRERGFHVVIGDRTLPGSRYLQDIGWRRRMASSVFSAFVGTLVTGGFFDTQCGLKGMRGDVADAVFSLQRLERFAFDVELVYLALYHRLDIKRIPVRLRNNETSSVRLFRDSVQGALDVLRIKYHQVRGYYESDALEKLVTQDFVEARIGAAAGR
jgi:dolichyl-phosphate beta-glucosyltransferase